MTLTSPWSHSALVVLAALAASCSPKPAARRPSQELLDEIKAQGAKVVVNRLESPSAKDQWETILRDIQTGAPEWLGVARELLEGTDAGTTEAIYQSLAIALTNNAEAVLALAGDIVPMNRICTVPYIEPDPATVASHKLRALAALKKVTLADLISKRDACANAISQVQ